MRLSEHFSRSEFKCKCGKCGHDVVDIELLNCLEDLHLYLDAKYLGTRVYIEIISGNRCQSHNSKVGGAKSSQHILGKAADIRCWLEWHKKQISPNIIYKYLDRMYHDKYGIGWYDSFTHFDIRPGPPARWGKK